MDGFLRDLIGGRMLKVVGSGRIVRSLMDGMEMEVVLWMWEEGRLHR